MLPALFLCLCTCLPAFAHSACPPFNGGEPQQVARVYDGDTLELSDGNRVRLAGINTPELGRDDRPEEPLATQAREQLRLLLSKAGRQVRLQPAVEGRDHYGRRLAHAYSPDGANLQERLLEEGLALVYIHPPNLGNLDCYLAAETRARNRAAGLWRHWPVAASAAHEPGFALLRGRVERVRRTRRSLWLELADGPSLRIAGTDLGRFDYPDPATLPGKEIEARGWLYLYRGQLNMRIRHPAALRIMH